MVMVNRLASSWQTAPLAVVVFNGLTDWSLPFAWTLALNSHDSRWLVRVHRTFACGKQKHTQKNIFLKTNLGSSLNLITSTPTE